jgi:hypothetical protein
MRKNSSVNKVPSSQTGTAEHFPLLDNLSHLATITSKVRVCLSGSKPNYSTNSMLRKLWVLPVLANKTTRTSLMTPEMRIIWGVGSMEIA